MSAADEKLRNDSAQAQRETILEGENGASKSPEKSKEPEKKPEKTDKEKLHDRVQEMRSFVGDLRSHIDKPKNAQEIKDKNTANTYHKTVKEDCEHALEFPDDFSVQEVSAGLSHLAGVFAIEMRGAGLDGMKKEDRDEANDRAMKARGLFMEAMEKMVPNPRSAAALRKALENRIVENGNDWAAQNALSTLEHLNDPDVKGVIRYNVLANGSGDIAEGCSQNGWDMVENAGHEDENPTLVAESESRGLRLEVFRFLETQRENSAKLLFGNAANRIEDLQKVREAKTVLVEQEMEKKK